MPTDQATVLHFPVAGLDVLMGFDRQPVRKLPDGTYSSTTPLGVNVRGYDRPQDRARGGSRPGTVKYLAARPGNVRWVVQNLNVIVFMSSAAVG